MVITFAGMIGVGKSTLSTIMGERLGTEVYYEPVTNNPVLPLFYKDPKRYAFELQIYFLSQRLDSITNALVGKNNILDRSIYEDSLFFHTNAKLGRVGDDEKDAKVLVDIYDELLERMMRKIHGMPKTSPDLMIGIKVSYDTMIKRIKKRGRDYEQVEADPSLVAYYNALLDAYEDFFNGGYTESPIVVIDGDKYDFVENEEDRAEVISQINDAMVENKLISEDERMDIHMPQEKLEELISSVKGVTV